MFERRKNKNKKACLTRMFCYDDDDTQRILHAVTHGRYSDTWPTSFKKFSSFFSLFWCIGTFSFVMFALIYALVLCAFWAILVYFTYWGLIASNIYFLIRLISNIYNRYTQNYHYLLWDPEWDSSKKQSTQSIPSAGIVLWGLTMQSQLVAFVWETFIVALYWIGCLQTNECSLELTSINAHIVTPILVMLDILISEIPFPPEHIYKIPFYANLYVTFGAIHYYNNWGHFINGQCENGYYQSITLRQFYVYEQFNYANTSTFLYIFGLVCFACVILGFIVYVFKQVVEED
jgi:hypothetical protein